VIESVQGYDGRGATVAKRDAEDQRLQRVETARDNDRAADKRRADNQAREAARDAQRAEQAAERRRVDVRA
jgi:hypothetical protein